MTADTGVVSTVEHENRAPRRFPTAPVLALGAFTCMIVGSDLYMQQHSFHYVCPFKAMTGLDCPGCGITRACAALAHGNIVRAADHNLLFVALLPVLAYGWVIWLFAAMRGKPMPTPSSKFLYGLLIVTLIFWVVRNIPGVPFLASS